VACAEITGYSTYRLFCPIDQARGFLGSGTRCVFIIDLTFFSSQLVNRIDPFLFLTIGHGMLCRCLQLPRQLHPPHGTGSSSAKILPFPHNHSPGDAGRPALPGAFCGGI